MEEEPELGLELPPPPPLPAWAEGLPAFAQQGVTYAQQAWEIAAAWLLSPAAWSQFGLLLAAYILARLVSARVVPFLRRILTPAEDSTSFLAPTLRFFTLFLPLLLPLLAYAFTAAGEQITRAIFESGAVIAFGKRVFLVIAAFILVREVITDGFLKLLAKYVLIPVLVLNALGLLDLTQAYLTASRITLGNISFTAMDLVRGVIAGSILFWLGSWSNRQSADYIKRQEEMRPSIRELTTKAVEFLIFGVAFLLLMNIMGINLSALAVLGGAIGVGLGFGLQKIASNFISGVILLLEGQATVGDFVELDGGEAGTIVKMTARAAILQTFDGRWIVVPNEDFIVSRVVNYSDSGSAKRYEVPFSVSYDSDLEEVCAIINAAVSDYEHVLMEPEKPDTEIRAFGDNGVELAVEFWCNGLDDGPNRFTADVHMIVWKALKAHNIEIPFPQRVVELRGDVRARVK
ncbi:MAG: mechanosensitive ion channel domain-containing protein [Pseudomonadota bacterium]